MPLNPGTWFVEQCMIEGFAIVAELRPSWSPSAMMLADAGRITANPDIEAGPITLALLDIPNLMQPASSGPAVLVAASRATAGWKRRPAELSVGGQAFVAQTAPRKSTLGSALTILPAGEPYLIDTVSAVDVQLIDANQWLTSCDDDALAAGMNLAAIGSELIQFGEATPLGPGEFRLRRLLRGRGGTEWASLIHGVGDIFCLIESGAVEPLILPSWSVGALVTVTVRNNPTASATISAASLRPPQPVNLAAAVQTTGDLEINWTRRSRVAWSWNDEVDAPLGERLEQYRVTLTGSAINAEFLSDKPSLSIPATTVAGLGAGPINIDVRQVGDCAASRAAQLSINLP